MTVIEEKPWKRLNVNENENGTLFRFLSGSSFDYTFQWTDLTNIYREALSSQDINKRLEIVK